LVGFLARELLCDLITATSSKELADQQLALLVKLLGAAAAAVAVPGAGWEASAFAGTVTEALAMTLQVREFPCSSCLPCAQQLHGAPATYAACGFMLVPLELAGAIH
jgi:hypothetical protein